MRGFIILAVFMMTALITTSGCDLGKILENEAKDGFESVKPDPDPLVAPDGKLVDAIRGTGDAHAPGFTIKTKSITGAITTKYINIALVKLEGRNTVTLVYFNSVEMTVTDGLTKTIARGRPGLYNTTWDVVAADDSEYYIYIWLTKEKYTAKPTLTSDNDPTKFFTELASGKTVIDVAASGSNKYYAKGK